MFTVDVARFIRREERGFGGVFFTAVNTIFPILVMYLTGIMMLGASGRPDPGVTLVRLIGPLGLAVTLVTQVRINLLNLYGGTLGLANFFSRIFGLVPGRQFWVVPFLVVATDIILTPFREHFSQVTIYISIFLCAWVSTLIGERVLVHTRHQLPSWSEVRRSYLPDYNVVGLVSMWLPVAIACVMASGLFGRHVRALAVPFSIVAPFLLPAAVAAALGPRRLVRSYVGRDLVVPPQEQEVVECKLCGGVFHRSDFALCPFHDGAWICSYCCMSELRCGTMCRRDVEVVGIPILEAD